MRGVKENMILALDPRPTVGTGHCHGSACSNAGSFIVDEDEDEDGQ